MRKHLEKSEYIALDTFLDRYNPRDNFDTILNDILMQVDTVSVSEEFKHIDRMTLVEMIADAELKINYAIDQVRQAEYLTGLLNKSKEFLQKAHDGHIYDLLTQLNDHDLVERLYHLTKHYLSKVSVKNNKEGN